MGYFLNLFSPETYEDFRHSNQNVVGFRKGHQAFAHRIKPGDKFICYLTRGRLKSPL
jgi:hypothetical protein